MKTRRIPFIKMHGAGNDFVLLTRDKTDVVVTSKLAQLLLDRHFGIGGDQLLVLDPGNSVKKHQLKIYNADGSEAEMCGNGVRAVASYLRDFRGVQKNITIHTKAGPIGILYGRDSIEVNMGRPILEGSRIPVKAKGPIIDRPLRVKDKIYRVHCVSMGNPHCVVYVDNVDRFPVETIGPLIERHPFFPKRVNVEFVQVLSKDHVKARIWERGAGLTLACGTGVCAVLVASARIEKTNRRIKIDVPGGQLQARWDADDCVYLSGPAETTFQGIFLI